MRRLLIETQVWDLIYEYHILFYIMIPTHRFVDQLFNTEYTCTTFSDIRRLLIETQVWNWFMNIIFYFTLWYGHTVSYGSFGKYWIYWVKWHTVKKSIGTIWSWIYISYSITGIHYDTNTLWNMEHLPDTEHIIMHIKWLWQFPMVWYCGH